MDDLTTTLRLRFLILGGLIFAVFILLGVQLWSLQLLHGQQYTQDAASNRLRTSTTAATRGRIFDRNGVPLVTNRSSMAVLAPTYIKTNKELIARLSQVLKMSQKDIETRLNNSRDAPLDPHVLAIDVSMEQIAYISEHTDLFPGVEIQAMAVRQYPQGTLAAQVLGYTGEISTDDLNDPAFKTYQASDIVGKSGAEREFESALQGVRGTKQLEVDAYGLPKRVLSSTPAESGQDVGLTLDVGVQKVAEQALSDALTTAQSKGSNNAKAGCAIALDVKTGAVLAMASAPSYDPAQFIGGIKNTVWDQLNAKDSEYPLTNRAISSMYPPASTFKSFVALAALNDGLATANTTFKCEGRWTGLGEQWAKKCWDLSGHGTLNMVQAITQSCDIYFYNIGKAFYEKGGELLQSYVSGFGYGSKTGIDLPGEAAGRVPTAAWKKAWNVNYPDFQQWVPGDTVNMAIGQGDMLATPMQVATAYAAIANNGVMMRPHILNTLTSNKGKVLFTYKPKKEKTQPKVSASSLATIRTALRAVVTSGTAKSAFRTYQTPVAGKTGTAQVAGKDDYTWFVGYAPADNPQYCVLVLIEQSGETSVAAPAALQIFEQLFGQQVEHIIANDSGR